VRLEELGKLMKSYDLIGNLTRDLLTRRTVWRFLYGFEGDN
jgi:hypothetical protein